MLERIAVGVDNLRHDVVLSPRFVELGRAQIARSIARHGELEGLSGSRGSAAGAGAVVDEEAGRAKRAVQKNDPAEWKSALTELQVGSLNRAKKELQLSIDLLARLAVTKFVRTEMNQQFLQVLERCRVQLKSYENMRQGRAHEYRERLAAFQVRKRIILRKTGQEIFETLREVEKSTLARTRRSLFGEETQRSKLFHLSAVSEPAAVFRRRARRLSVRRTLRDAGKLGPRSGPLWPDAGGGLGFSALDLWRGSERRDARLRG